MGLGILWRLACVPFTLTYKQTDLCLNCHLQIDHKWHFLWHILCLLVVGAPLASLTWKLYYMNWLTTLWTSVFALVGLLDIKLLLVLALHLWIFIPMLLVAWLSRFAWWLLYYMNWLTTLWTSVFALVGLLDIKLLLVLALHLWIFIPMLLVAWLSRFAWWLLFLVFSCW